MKFIKIKEKSKKHVNKNNSNNILKYNEDYNTDDKQLITQNNNKDDLKEDQRNQVKASEAVTILMDKDNKLYFYEGIPEINTLKETSYGKDGLRAFLQRRNAVALNKVNKLKEERLKNASSNPKIMAQQDAEFRKKLSEIKSEKGVPNVIIKATDEALYENLINVLDEMQICGIGKYVIDKISDFDKKMIEHYKTEHPESAASSAAGAKANN